MSDLHRTRASLLLNGILSIPRVTLIAIRKLAIRSEMARPHPPFTHHPHIPETSSSSTPPPAAHPCPDPSNYADIHHLHHQPTTTTTSLSSSTTSIPMNPRELENLPPGYRHAIRIASSPPPSPSPLRERPMPPQRPPAPAFDGALPVSPPQPPPASRLMGSSALSGSPQQRAELRPYMRYHDTKHPRDSLWVRVRERSRGRGRVDVDGSGNVNEISDGKGNWRVPTPRFSESSQSRPRISAPLPVSSSSSSLFTPNNIAAIDPATTASQGAAAVPALSTLSIASMTAPSSQSQHNPKTENKNELDLHPLRMHPTTDSQGQLIFGDTPAFASALTPVSSSAAESGMGIGVGSGVGSEVGTSETGGKNGGGGSESGSGLPRTQSSPALLLPQTQVRAQPQAHLLIPRSQPLPRPLPRPQTRRDHHLDHHLDHHHHGHDQETSHQLQEEDHWRQGQVDRQRLPWGQAQGSGQGRGEQQVYEQPAPQPLPQQRLQQLQRPQPRPQQREVQRMQSNPYLLQPLPHQIYRLQPRHFGRQPPQHPPQQPLSHYNRQQQPFNNSSAVENTAKAQPAPPQRYANAARRNSPIQQHMQLQMQRVMDMTALDLDSLAGHVVGQYIAPDIITTTETTATASAAMAATTDEAATTAATTDEGTGRTSSAITTGLPLGIFARSSSLDKYRLGG